VLVGNWCFWPITPQTAGRAILGIGLRHQQLEPFLMTIEVDAGNADEVITHPGN
jgi:hypothetical protein